MVVFVVASRYHTSVLLWLSDKAEVKAKMMFIEKSIYVGQTSQTWTTRNSGISTDY